MTLHVILGSGAMPTKEVNATLTNLWTTDTKAKTQHWYLIQGKAEPTETDQAIMAWMHKNEIWYDLITDGDYDTKLYTEAQTVHKVKRLTPKVVSIMNAAKEGSEEEAPEDADMLAIFTDLENFAAEEDRWLNDVGAAVQEAGFIVFALNDGMIEVDMSDVEEEEEEEEQEEEGDEEAELATPAKYTNEELLDMDRADILRIAGEMGIELPPKTRIATYIKAIIEAGEREVEVAPVVEPPDEEIEETDTAAIVASVEAAEEEVDASLPSLIVVIHDGVVMSRAVTGAQALAMLEAVLA